MRRKALRAPRIHPDITVDYVAVIDRSSHEVVQMYLQPSVGATSDLMDEAVTDWASDDVDFDRGKGKLSEVLRGSNLQDAQQQLARGELAVVDTFKPRMPEVKKRMYAPKKLSTAAALETSTEGLLNELLAVLSDTNGLIQRLSDMEQEIHEAKADGEPVAAEANDVIMVAKDASGHLETARDILLKRLDVFLGGDKKKEASVRSASEEYVEKDGIMFAMVTPGMWQTKHNGHTYYVQRRAKGNGWNVITEDGKVIDVCIYVKDAAATIRKYEDGNLGELSPYVDTTGHDASVRSADTLEQEIQQDVRDFVTDFFSDPAEAEEAFQRTAAEQAQLVKALRLSTERSIEAGKVQRYGIRNAVEGLADAMYEVDEAMAPGEHRAQDITVALKDAVDAWLEAYTGLVE